MINTFKNAITSVAVFSLNIHKKPKVSFFLNKLDGFLYWMVAHFTMRTHGVNQAFHYVEGIWLHRKSRQIRFFFSKKDLVFIIRAQRKMSNHLI